MGLNIIKGRSIEPPRLVIYGPEKIGKSTLAAQAPNVLFVPTEDGLSQIGPPRLAKVEAFDEAIARVGEVINEDHDRRWLVIDTMDALEKVLWQEVANREQKPSIEKIGYAKGYKLALADWEQLIAGLDYVRSQKQMGIILICQAQVKAFANPEGETYDRYSLRLHELIANRLQEWADAILFATTKVRIDKTGEGFKERRIAKAIGKEGGERVLRCIGSPACLAGNRYGMPEFLPMEWEALEYYFSLKENPS